MEKIDIDTKKILDDDEKVEAFVESDSWKIIRQLLADKIMLLQSVSDLDLSMKPDEIAVDLRGRNYASNVLLAWLAEVEGTADKSKSQKQAFKKQSYVIER